MTNKLWLKRLRNDATRANAASDRKKSIGKFYFQRCSVNETKSKKERETTKQNKKI